MRFLSVNPENVGMKFLSIDPGKTTGFCYLELEYLPQLFYGQSNNAYAKDELLQSLEVLLTVKSAPEKAVVIIEQPPAQGDDLKLIAYFGELKKEYENQGLKVATINPGRWKPWVKQFASNITDQIQIKNHKHAKDSFAMLYFYLRTQGLIK